MTTGVICKGGSSGCHGVRSAAGGLLAAACWSESSLLSQCPQLESHRQIAKISASVAVAKLSRYAVVSLISQSCLSAGIDNWS
jgi:hypothetical protein